MTSKCLHAIASPKLNGWEILAEVPQIGELAAYLPKLSASKKTRRIEDVIHRHPFNFLEVALSGPMPFRHGKDFERGPVSIRLKVDQHTLWPMDTFTHTVLTNISAFDRNAFSLRFHVQRFPRAISIRLNASQAPWISEPWNPGGVYQIWNGEREWIDRIISKSLFDGVVSRKANDHSGLWTWDHVACAMFPWIASVSEESMTDDSVSRLCTLWNNVLSTFGEVALISQGRMAAREVRQQKILTAPAALIAIGRVLHSLDTKLPLDMDMFYGRLKNMDWRKSVNGAPNPAWKEISDDFGEIPSSPEAVAKLTGILEHLLGESTESTENTAALSIR